ncbi:glycoside hydrolase family 108 protein [Persephonella sp.]
MTEFEKAFNIVLEKEGIYSNNPYDKGGETKYGISKRAFPEIDIKNLSIDKAKELYYKGYWIPSKAYLMPEPLAVMHFDTAVNTGVITANRILQRALNKQGFNLKVDGRIGEKTLNALKNAILQQLISDYSLERIRYYTKIAKGNQRKFLKGWINRALSIQQIAESTSVLIFSALAALFIAYILFKIKGA